MTDERWDAVGAGVNASLAAEDIDAAVAAPSAGTEIAPADYWEDRYAGTDRVWSGAPNRTLAEVATGIPPGRVLDLGCGEGADVIWLAQRGWTATGIDISPTALARAAAAAAAAGLSPTQARFVSADLSTWSGDETYDLVTASFFHSPVALSRTDALRRAADRVVPGGHLLVVAHAALPPGADLPAGHEHHFLGPDEEIAALGLPAAEWTTLLAETRSRHATGPAAGEHITLDDVVVLLRRA